ncbi:MAG: hydantoinase B/oxoprolinase family protein [Desulfobulbaceae bacterium]|nr:hydantoinase B/oxoprolinase family protein [Desulfobulbaceae bacterium]
MNIIEVEVFNKLFASVAEEMGIVLARAAFSPNIKERHDFSCAIFDRRGELVAQAAHIPVHLGAMPRTLFHILQDLALGPGDVAIANDPFRGGSHLPDITVAEAVCDAGGTPLFYVVNRAHHADVGGKTPGSMGLSATLAEEGVLIPPTLLVAKGVRQPFYRQFLDLVRNPSEREGDLRAQMAALARGNVRLREMLAKHSAAKLFAVIDHLQDYAERLMRHTIASLRDGVHHFVDHLDDDGVNRRPLPIALQLTIAGDEAIADFSASADQVPSPLNTVAPVTLSATIYAFQCLMGEGFPINHGSYRPIRIITRQGSIVDAIPPAPVAAGNVETSQRLVDVLFGALAQAAPGRIPAASCGSMNNIAIGGEQPGGGHYAYYETIGGGMGARPGSDGLHGIHTHMTNTMNTPVEALEHAYPLQVERYGLTRDSGGNGKHRGGDGIVRSYRFLAGAQVSLLTERRRLAPYGLKGGNPGAKGKNELIRGKKRKRLPGKINLHTEAGDILIIKTPGGGGWGEKT